MSAGWGTFESASGEYLLASWKKFLIKMSNGLRS